MFIILSCGLLVCSLKLLWLYPCNSLFCEPNFRTIWYSKWEPNFSSEILSKKRKENQAEKHKTSHEPLFLNIYYWVFDYIREGSSLPFYYFHSPNWSLMVPTFRQGFYSTMWWRSRPIGHAALSDIWVANLQDLVVKPVESIASGIILEGKAFPT